MVPNLNMAILQKQLSRKVGNKEYIKYVVVIPSEIVKEAKMKEGDTIKFSVKKGEISLINFGK